MSAISFGKYLSLSQAAKAILANPKLRFFLEGEPGIGKSSLTEAIRSVLSGHEWAYVDVPNLDLGDVAMPWIDKETNTTRYAPNARFKLHTGKPVVLNYDEFTKGMQPVQNMLHPSLEKNKPRLGDHFIDPESIIFLTGNLSTDGVGDRLKSHTANRVVRLKIRKPSAEEWLNWAANNSINPMVMAFVHQFPHVMASYLDEGQQDNPYIFNPRKVQDAFASPRSLETASDILNVRDQVDVDTTIASLTGAVGEACARDLYAFVEYQDQLPSWDSIIKDPMTARIPDGAGATSVLIFGAVTKIDRQTINPFMQYVARLEPEWQAAFAINVARSPQKQGIAFTSKAFADWVQANEDIL